jgi:[acyl-carrier-protein] S-malonyltransferase
VKTGWIFPAFISEYIGHEDQILDSLSSDFESLLKLASDVTGENLIGFQIGTNNFMDKENLNQYLSYVFSCSVTHLLKKNNHKPDYISGLSMGIYAALYAGESITFEDGLRCIKEAYDLSVANLNGYEFGMGAIIGLTYEELHEITKSVSENVEIVNSNGIHSFIVSGISPDVKKVAMKAQDEGAFHSGLLAVSCPYHSKFMNNIATEFQRYVSCLDIKSSMFPMVSVIDQSVFKAPEEIINELARNLDSEINWFKTMKTMLQLRIHSFIECGAGRSLYKIGKFIEGDFTIIPLNKLSGYLDKPYK